MSTTVASSKPGVSDELLARARQIGEQEMARLLERTKASARLYERAVRLLPFGVVSSFQKMQPYPIYVTRGREAISGTRTGRNTSTSIAASAPWWVGHAHPRIVEAISQAASRGTHFAATTEEGIAFGEEIARRFNLEMVRFANSGTEATMDAIRVARAATGRDVICKIEGRITDIMTRSCSPWCPTRM